MIDAKIPKEERDSILLLADGPEIWWVVGYRRGESGRVGGRHESSSADTDWRW